jgi:hypothetical protein
MARTTRSSRESSSSNNVQEDDHNAISGSISDLAERVAQQEALDAIAEANALGDGIIDPAAKRLSLIAQVNATKLASEKARKIAKGLLILQSKQPPFEVEDMLMKNDILQLKLTEDETNELLEEYIKNATIEKNKDNSVKFVDAMVRLSPPLNKESTRKLQEWSDKYQDEMTPLHKLLDPEAITLLKVLIEDNKKKLHLTNDEASNWYTQWNHVDLAAALTRMFKKRMIRILERSMRQSTASRLTWILESSMFLTLLARPKK